MVPILKSLFPHANVSMLLRSYTKDVASGAEGLSEILAYDHNGKLKSFFEMLRELRLGRYDLAIIAFPRFRISLLLWLAGIPARLGTGYRWYSFLFNLRVFEHRKVGQKHESEYNLGLLKGLGVEPPVPPKPAVRFSEEDRLVALALMHELGIQKDDPWIILHPGSGGSARDWKAQNFGALATHLAEKGFTVAVTGGPGEDSLVAEVVKCSNGGGVPVVNRLNLKQLAALISFARLFVSNSTGPLHIASAVGTPVIGFYPDIPACSAVRWGPLTDRRVVFIPNRKNCPLCIGGECRSDLCMDQIRVEDVAKAALKLAARSRNLQPIETN